MDGRSTDDVELTYPFWTKTIEAMTRTGDSRVIAVVKKRLKQPQGGSKFWPKFYTALEKAIAKIAEVPSVPVDEKLVDKLTKAARKLDVAAPAKRASASAKPTAPALAGPLLGQAIEHLDAGRVQPAIDAMCARWREVRDPTLANAIDHATKLLPSYDQSLGLTDKEAHAAWMTAFAADPYAAMPQLLQHLLVGGPAMAEKHLVELASLPEDPRIAWRLAELCVGRSASPERTQFWKSLLELVERTRDQRTAPALRVAFSNFEGNYYNHHRQARRILGNWVQTLTPYEELARDELDQIASIVAKVQTLEAKQDGTERALLNAIIDAWADDGPRHVYADWLTERGHPRGEAIMLGCHKSTGVGEMKNVNDRMRKTSVIYGYLDDLAEEWSADRNLGLDRGLPTRIVVEWKTSPLLWRRFVGYPLVSLVEKIVFEDERSLPPVDDFATLLLDPNAKRLTTVENVPADFKPNLGSAWKIKGKHLVRA